MGSAPCSISQRSATWGRRAVALGDQALEREQRLERGEPA
jgi:hypothetical protein